MGLVYIYVCRRLLLLPGSPGAPDFRELGVNLCGLQESRGEACKFTEDRKKTHGKMAPSCNAPSKERLSRETPTVLRPYRTAPRPSGNAWTRRPGAPARAEHARALLVRRYGAAPPADAAERASRARFLYYRGFQGDHVRAAFAALGAGGDPADHEEPPPDLALDLGDDVDL